MPIYVVRFQQRITCNLYFYQYVKELFSVFPASLQGQAHWPGWVPVSATAPEDRWHREALQAPAEPLLEGHTYELVGPALSKNPYGLSQHVLWRHGRDVVEVPDRRFEALARFLAERDIEGLVFHHPDGRMAKIRRKDFGLFWVQDDLRRPSRRRLR